ncbi:restriction endonuclease subunit S [Akkermansiaceae bacterium]|nr:restriction endonuclease subunit S [Akkermansiaceae bacterium]
MSLSSPEIRFKDDNGNDLPDWEEKTIGDVAEIKGGKRVPKGKVLESIPNGFPYITVSDFDRDSVDLRGIRYVPLDVVDKIKSYTINTSDIFISVAGTLGLVGVIPDSLDGANLTENANKLTNLKCDKSFLLQYLKSERFKSLIESVKTTGAQPKLAIYAIKAFRFPKPSPHEQKKIADFLTSVDERIGQLIKKKALLEDYKKGVMQQLFSQQIRFKDDNGNDFPDWEEKKLGEVADLISGFAFKSEYFGEGGQKLITPKNFTKNGAAFFDVSNIKYTTEEVPEKFMCDSGDLLVLLTDLTPSCELLGRPALLNNGDGTVLLNQRIVKVVVNSEHISALYLAKFLQSPKYRRKIIRTAVGSTVRHSSNKILLSIATPIASLEEQKKIADFLTSVDQKIESVSQQIAKTQTFKKGLLQQMFV